MLISYHRGQGSIILRVKILNSSVSTGAGLTGLTSASTGLIISTIADNESTATAYTVAGSTIETITTLGTFAAPTATKCRFKEVDSTNHKGIYEVQIADARYAVSSAKSLLVSISGATNCAETDAVVPLTDVDPYDAVHFGISALPNAAAAASNGLLTFGSSTGQINPASGKVPATLASTDVTGNVAADLQTIKTQAVTCSASVTIEPFVGTVTAAIAVDGSGHVTAGTVSDKTGYSLTQSFPANFASLAITSGGIVKADLQTILAAAISETVSGNLAAAYKKFFDVSLPTSTMNEITLVDTVTTAVTATSLTNAPTAGDFTATMKTSLNAATPASVQNISAQTGDSYAALTGTTTEPTTPPAATASILDKIKWLFCLGKNKRTQTSTTELVRNDGDSATIGTSTKSDDATTFIRGKYV